jgi:hypothetical protein
MMGVLLAKLLLQNAATTGNGNAANLMGMSKNITFFIEGSGTITGGTISLESARTKDYTGDWSVIQSVNATDVNSDAVKAVHVVGNFLAVRARISSDITGGGNVSVELVAE